MITHSKRKRKSNDSHPTSLDLWVEQLRARARDVSGLGGSKMGHDMVLRAANDFLETEMAVKMLYGHFSSLPSLRRSDYPRKNDR